MAHSHKKITKWPISRVQIRIFWDTLVLISKCGTYLFHRHFGPFWRTPLRHMVLAKDSWTLVRIRSSWTGHHRLLFMTVRESLPFFIPQAISLAIVSMSFSSISDIFSDIYRKIGFLKKNSKILKKIFFSFFFASRFAFFKLWSENSWLEFFYFKREKMIHKNSAEFTYLVLEKSRMVWFFDRGLLTNQSAVFCLLFVSKTAIKFTFPGIFPFSYPKFNFCESSSLTESQNVTQKQINCFILFPDPSRKITIFMMLGFFVSHPTQDFRY